MCLCAVHCLTFSVETGRYCSRFCICLGAGHCFTSGLITRGVIRGRSAHMIQPETPQKDDFEESQVERVRRICLDLPETWEKISHGEPTFFVRKKVFATSSMNHHNDGHYVVVI